MNYKKHPELIWRNILALPVVLTMIPPLIILDIFLEIYHRIGFLLYSIPPVHRSHYIKIDRHRLKYLTLIDKFGCAYCGYANGLLRYASIIASETEKYWCGVKHKKNEENNYFIEPEHHKNFLEYGDEKSYKNFGD